MDNNNKQDPNMKSNWQTITMLVVAAILTFIVVSSMNNYLNSKKRQELSYNEFVQMVEAGEVDSIKVGSTEITVIPKKGNTKYSQNLDYYVVRLEGDYDFVNRILDNNVVTNREKSDSSTLLLVLLNYAVPFLFLLFLMNFTMKRMGGGGIMGVGASRVRDLFKNATENAPCIIFIDEIDAIGRSRDSRMGGNDEREQTLNQLLSEMDGFDSTKGLLVLGATNRPEVLDPALLRPGRFDRRVVVDKPDLNGRINILKVHSKDVLLDESVDFKEIALATSGAVGADLANMMNEAAINAVKHGRNAVSQKDLFEAVEVVLVGKEKKDRIMSKEERRIVSYHEVGHALVSALQKHSEPVQKITIVPRTMGALGYVMNVPEEEKYLNTKKELEARLVELMAGRAAEEIVFETVTTGAANDIQQATNLARAMVTQYGMSDKFGLMGLESQENQYLTGRAVLNCGDATAAEIDQEVMKILKDSYDEAIRLLSDNKDAMDQIAAITGKEFMKIFRRVKGIPEPEEPKEDDDKGTASQELHANPETQADRGERENQAEQANPQEQVNPEEQANPQEQVNPEEQANPQTQSNPGNQSGPEVSDRGNEPEKKTEDTVWSHPGNDRNL